MTRRSGNGAGLMGAFRVAVQNLERHVDEVNALNVFPVPDGDTGSNMLATVKAALAQAESQADQSAAGVAQAISFGALMGARGNSGVIASQIFRGMAEALGGKDRFDGSDLARALNQGTATAYKAVGKPVEGTILTVIREAAAVAVVSAEAGGDLEVVLTAAVEAAREAVAKTPSLLPVLRDAGVVDAGGEGLYRLMQGTLQYLVARTRVEGRRAAQQPAQVGATGAAEGFGYETMFLLQAGVAPVDVDRLKAELDAMGDSVLVAGDSRAVTVHVHNARPDQVIALGLSMGSLTRITVENLDAQSDEVREQKAAEVVGAHIEVRPRATHQDGRPHVELDTFGAELAASGGGEGANGSAGSNGTGGDGGLEAVASLAVVAVAAGEGMARIFHSYGVAAVVRGGQAANPSTGELLDAVEKIEAHEVLLLPNNPNVILAARQASELTTRRVRVVPTRSAAEGFAALLALDPDRDATANAEVMTLAGRAVQTLQVTEAVRDATIGGHKVRKGQTIVLDPDDGLLAVGGNRLKAILGALAALEPGFELVTLYYGAGVDRAEAESVAARVVEWRRGLEVELIEGGQPHYRYLIAAE